jgi:hypothetical protein
MASANDEQDFVPSVAPGYKITEKKTVDEYQTLDAKFRPLSNPTDVLPLATTLCANGKRVSDLPVRQFRLTLTILERYFIAL